MSDIDRSAQLGVPMEQGWREVFQSNDPKIMSKDRRESRSLDDCYLGNNCVPHSTVCDSFEEGSILVEQLQIIEEYPHDADSVPLCNPVDNL